jgi:hypothetical protein
LLGGVQSKDASMLPDISVSVSIGHVLYFMVDSNSGDDFCDSTGVDVTIAKGND